MQSVNALLEWLQASSWAVFIHKTAWAFSTIAVVHAFAASLMLVMIVMVDLRRLGFASTRRPFAELSRQLMPLTWVAFMLAAITGLLMFASRPTEYLVNAEFWIKMSLIVVAGINIMIFEFITARDIQKWNLDPTPPAAARRAGGISTTCWILVVIFGRVISFTLPME